MSVQSTNTRASFATKKHGRSRRSRGADGESMVSARELEDGATRAALVALDVEAGEAPAPAAATRSVTPRRIWLCCMAIGVVILLVVFRHSTGDAARAVAVATADAVRASSPSPPPNPRREVVARAADVGGGVLVVATAPPPPAAAVASTAAAGITADAAAATTAVASAICVGGFAAAAAALALPAAAAAVQPGG